MFKLILLFLTFIAFASCTSYGRSNSLDIAKFADYPSRTYQVQTLDGYKLILFRIPHGPNEKSTNRPAVLLMHGMMSSSSDFFSSFDRGFAIDLVDSGFDVFIGNTRGSPYGLDHDSLDPHKDPEFWNYSFDEIATRDLPAIVDKVLSLTDESQISYVGHMEGSMIFYMMVANSPDYAQKFKRMAALGPMAFMKNTRSKFLHRVISNHICQKWIDKNVGQTMFSASENLMIVPKYDCQQSDSEYKDLFCDNNYFLIKGYDSKNLNRTLLKTVANELPYGSSRNQILHLAQLAETGRFQTFPSEWSGPVHTTEYNLTLVTVPIGLFYTPNDALSHINDIKTLAKRLPKVDFDQNFRQLKNSIDLIYSEDVSSIVFVPVTNFLKAANAGSYRPF